MDECFRCSLLHRSRIRYNVTLVTMITDPLQSNAKTVLKASLEGGDPQVDPAGVPLFDLNVAKAGESFHRHRVPAQEPCRHR